MKRLAILLLTPAFLFAGYFEDGMKSLKEGKYEKAMRYFDTDIQERPDMPFSYSGKVKCLWYLKDYNKALAVARYAVARFPDNLISTHDYVMAAAYSADIAADGYFENEIADEDYITALKESIKADDAFLAAAAKHPKDHRWRTYSYERKEYLYMADWVEGIILARGICESRIVAVETIKGDM